MSFSLNTAIATPSTDRKRTNVSASSRLAWLLAACLVAPLAQAADECHIELGRGWPPATESHGTAVEGLFANGATPVMTLTTLPERTAESGLQLIAAESGDWTLRHSVADKRVSVWADNKLQLRTDQTPEVVEVPMPAELGRRLVAAWRGALEQLVPADLTAPFKEDVTLYMVDGLRVSGAAPTCGPAAILGEQAALLIEATDDGDKRRERRWVELGESLDKLATSLAGDAG
ncbi:hypothetical protein [Montanilutibacter psychrotolerans]|uniref:hypothetical protein n=1 Tax=Montanilutibacter psychrotolerans TaxID=1327343 RepID=UPI001CC2045E|nr:hypothetical protein [Lysobacter psychrotolerans]